MLHGGLLFYSTFHFAYLLAVVSYFLVVPVAASPIAVTSYFQQSFSLFTQGAYVQPLFSMFIQYPCKGIVPIDRPQNGSVPMLLRTDRFR